MAPRRVLLGTPALDGRVEAAYAYAIAETKCLCVARGIDLRLLIVTRDSMLPNVRNDIVAAAVEHDFDDLIVADGDQDWKPEAVLQLLSWPVDCIGAPVRKKTDEAEFYNVRVPGGPASLARHPEHPILTAPGMAVGAGFLRLSKGALRALWEASEPYVAARGRKPSRWVFEYGFRRGTAPGAPAEIVPEDIGLCAKLEGLGIPTWLDPAIDCGHTGAKRWQGNFAAWLAKLEAAAAQSRAA